MKIKLVTHPKSPLDLPEIRTRIATFLTRKDCISCMCVSQNWFKDFLKPVWHTIDVTKDKMFIGLPSNVLEKYGHSVRRILNVSTWEHALGLQHPKLREVKAISIENHREAYHRVVQYDFIRRCSGTLTDLEFRCRPRHPDTMSEQLKRSDFYLDANALIPSPTCGTTVSLLESLSLSRVCLSHEGFTALLRNSPVLRKLTLFKVAVVHFNKTFGIHHQSSVTSLHASLADICEPNPSGWCPSLLHHFPRLQEWHLTAVDRSKNWGQDVQFRHELAQCCPLLNTLRFDPVANTDKLSDLLVDCIRLPASCTLAAKNMSASMLTGLATHCDTLTSITITDKCTDEAASMRWLYLIPKMCLNLKVLSMEKIVLEMYSVNEHKWRCNDLRELRVLFKGLEDPKPIDECLTSVCLQRRRPGLRATNESISSQVSQHLLQFPKLTTVWLGTKDYCLPLPTDVITVAALVQPPPPY
ncbi:hypothetical protein BGX24_011164 [Mortierella sp. AD032]|nr:hypothetical protein BGX24_011164 [Mortierella sp. AD032]